jgi:hypothetical protein
LRERYIQDEIASALLNQAEEGAKARVRVEGREYVAV